MNFGAHKLLISGNQFSSVDANIMACCTFSTGHRRKTYGVAFFVLVFFFPPPTLLAAGAFKDSSHHRLGRSGFSRIILCRDHAFRPGECVGKAVSSQPRHREQLGITPTFRTSCWQAQGVTSDALHTSPVGGRHFPLANRICLVGRAGRGGQAFQPGVLKRGERSLLPGFEWSPAELQLLPHAFLWFSLLHS